MDGMRFKDTVAHSRQKAPKLHSVLGMFDCVMTEFVDFSSMSLEKKKKTKEKWERRNIKSTKNLDRM